MAPGLEPNTPIRSNTRSPSHSAGYTPAREWKEQGGGFQLDTTQESLTIRLCNYGRPRESKSWQGLTATQGLQREALPS